MSAQPGAYERSVIMLRDERQLQRQAYNTEIVKIFYQRAAEESLLVSRIERQAEAYADPRIASLKTSGSLEYSCLLYFYDKKTFTKSKVVGSKYSDGEFEVKEGGCMTSKVTKFSPYLFSPLLIETSASPVQKQVLWEGKYQYRTLFLNDKQTQLHGVYSDQEFDLLKLISNLEIRRVKELTAQPRNQSLVHFMRKEMPGYLAVAKAELLYQALMDLLATSEFFIQKQNNYDSVVADDEIGFQTESRVPTTPGLQRRTTGVMDDRSLEGDSLHEAGSYFGNQSAGSPGLNLVPKAQSDFVMSKRSELNLQTIARSRVDIREVSESKTAPLGVENQPELTYASMVKAISPNALDQHVQEPQASTLSEFKSIGMAGRHDEPGNSQAQVSTSRSFTGRNPDFSTLKNPKRSMMKKNPHPFTVESHESTLKSELITRPPVSTNPSIPPKPTSPKQDTLSPPQRNGPTRNIRQDSQSKLAGDPYANGVPTMGSELNFKSRVGHQHSNYFQAGADKARGAVLGAQSTSDLQSNLLLDFRQPLSTIDENIDTTSKRTVLVSSMAIPACIDYSTLSLLLLCRGVTRIKVPGTNTENIKVRSNLLKRISLEGACRGVLPEFNHFLVAINQKVTVDAYSTEMDFFELLLASKDEKMVYGSVILRKEFLEKLDSERVPMSVPIVLEELEARKLGLSQGKAASIDAIGSTSLVVFVNLLPGEIAESIQQEKKSKQLSQQACRIHQSVSQTQSVISDLDRALSSSIKNRRTDELRFLLKVSLPPNVLLMVWLLVTKKFRLMKNVLSSNTTANSKGLSLFDPMEKLKSTIMQSMYSTKKELGELELNNRVSVHFHRLLRTLDKQGVLSNVIQYYSLSSMVSSLKGEYFKTGINRYKLMEFIFSRIMADYFDMYLADPIQQTHLSSSVVGPAKRNALLTRGFRGCSRDHLILHIYINNHCQRTAKAVQLNSKDFVIWIVDHILSVNIGLLKDNLGSEHLHFLFSQSIQHKDDPNAQFGWLINLMLHVFILERVEKLLSDRVIVYCEKGSATTPEQLYGTVLSSSGLIYQDFIQKYLLFEGWIAEKRLKSQQSSLIGNFFNNLAKSTTEGTSKPGMESMWTIYEDCLENPDIQKLQLKNQQENITILQLCKLEVKPSKALNLLKSKKQEQTRRIVLRIHGVLNKDYPNDEFVFHALCDSQEPDSSSQHPRSSLSQDATFTFNHSGAYAPIVQLRLQVVGDELLYRHNTMIVGTKNLQLRRFQPNTVHNLMLEVYSEPRNKVYFLKTSILVQEISKDAGQPASSDREGVPECLRAKYLGQQGFLLMDNFKHPISNFEGLITKHLQGLFDDLGMDITDCYTGGRFRSYGISGYHLQAHPEGKSLKLSEDELRSELDTFQSSLKVLLFKNQFEMLEDYIIRYFGSDQNSITASEVVYVLQSIFKVLGVRTHLLEVVAYIEGVIKREISPKLESCSLLLGMDTVGSSAGLDIGKSKYVDLKRHVVELISYLSIKKNSATLIYGDRRSLFLLKDFVDKMRLEKYLTI